ncbi:hypothetical protein PPGU19_085200 (plasmid) [Paraburkholderia sp. PGU19]|uniref:hypothetical protein n=1 Tax=Paraburkholderia sp. PGU19 TaxID=2735434 RepID=UPI0015DB7B77|nr:hypothetical protein [Paraburkholderia sp. PGU19]BCG03952.1 hypothetical protein PPGU19_085200 [Paraburkholderia sp. PGU19]
MQNWTYDELTHAAETEIKRQIDKANTTSDIELRKRHEYAFGVYLAWEAILRLHPAERHDEDAQRLRQLTGAGR